MNIEKYKTFLACVSTRTFNDAADVLYITPSTVSKHIAALEKELGCVLFVRTPKGLILTDEGERRVPVIKELISSYDRLMMISSSDSDSIKALQIYTSPVFDRFGLQDMIEAFSLQHAGFPFEISEQGYVSAALESHRCELAFMYSHQLDSSMFDQLLFHVGHFGVLVQSGHPLASRKSLSPSELQGEELVAVQARDDIENGTSLFTGLDVAFKFVFAREDSAFAHVRNHNRIALFPSDIYNIYRPMDLVFVPLEPHLTTFGVLAKLHNVPLSRHAQVFWDYAQAWLHSKKRLLLP